jgi:hypothetical protein
VRFATKFSWLAICDHHWHSCFCATDWISYCFNSSQHDIFRTVFWIVLVSECLENKCSSPMFWLKYIWRLKSTTDVAFWVDIRCKKNETQIQSFSYGFVNKKRLQPYVWTQMNPYSFSFGSSYCVTDRVSP